LKSHQADVMTARVNEYGLAWSQVSSMPRNHRKAPHTATAMIRSADMDVRVSKMPPDKEQLIFMLQELQRLQLPFHPLILVFSTGKVSEQDCVQMKRSPMPKTGSPFNLRFDQVLAEAYALNPSIHDGAIVFTKIGPADDYRLAAWSMRIVSRLAPTEPEANLGSAHNSALSLSVSPNVDLCCVMSQGGFALFEKGTSLPKTAVI
jgi:hypothetical protein